MRSSTMVQTFLVLCMIYGVQSSSYAFRRQQQQQRDDIDILASRILDDNKSGTMSTKVTEKRSQAHREEEKEAIKISDSLIKREESNIEESEEKTKSSLKREIIHALIKLLHDELDKQQSQQKSQDSYASVRNTGARDANEKLQHITSKRSQKSTKRREERMPNARSLQEEEKRNIKLTHDELVRGPPGLWGDAMQAEKRSLRGPPGLWGRDTSLEDEAIRAKKRDFFKELKDESGV